MAMNTTANPNPMHRRDFLQRGALATLGVALSAGASAAPQVEWRNKQADMPCRRLGRTNLMISEMICGGTPISRNNFRHVELAVDMGVNLLDMAPQYGRGDAELAFGELLRNPAVRERVFLSTKISNFSDTRNRLYKEIFDGLPSEKQNALVKRSQEMLRDEYALQPDYFVHYFGGQQRQLEENYLSNAMAQDYRHKVEGSGAFRKTMMESLEGSLQRAGVDCFDIVMCPHAASSSHEVDIPEIHETFLEMKKQGKARYLGVSSHNNPAGVLRKATESGHFDMALVAYNLVNGGYMEEAIRAAHAADVGVIAMKAANPVVRQHPANMPPIPDWRVQKLNALVPGEYTAPQKAYIWALQNPRVACVNANLWDENYVKENLVAAGKKVELQPA